MSKKKQIVKIDKSNLIYFLSDNSGCSHIRCTFISNYLFAIYGKHNKLTVQNSSLYMVDQTLLLKTRNIIFQRQHTIEAKKKIEEVYFKHKNKLGYKLTYEIDDDLWNIPDYNFANEGITNEIKDIAVEIMKMMDKIIVSTEPLKKQIQSLLPNKDIVVIPNVVPMYLYGEEIRNIKTKDIKKPRILYAGSPTHYNNTKKLLGDFSKSWVDYIINSVNNNEIEFIVMGGLPWFLEPIKDKIEVVGWANMYQFPNILKRIGADFSIMPLKDNLFNSSKSDIKYLESCSIGAIGIGTKFDSGNTSPYDNNMVSMSDNVTENQIRQTIKDFSKKDKFNDIIESQYNYLLKNDKYLESAGFIKHYTDTMLT